MKVEHLVLFPEIIERSTGTVLFKLEYLEDYLPDDLNIHLAVYLLQVNNLVNDSEVNSYHNLKNDYLYNKTISLGFKNYTGPLADHFTELEIEKQKIMSDPDYAVNMTALFNNYHFGDEIPENLPDVTDAREASFQLMQLQNRVSNEIAQSVTGIIKTIGWPRLADHKFDYTIPATLVLDLYEYDKSLLTELNAKALEIVQSVESKKAVNEFGEDYWIFTINSHLLR